MELINYMDIEEENEASRALLQLYLGSAVLTGCGFLLFIVVMLILGALSA